MTDEEPKPKPDTDEQVEVEVIGAIVLCAHKMKTELLNRGSMPLRFAALGDVPRSTQWALSRMLHRLYTETTLETRQVIDALYTDGSLSDEFFRLMTGI